MHAHTTPPIRRGALVLYKHRPARVSDTDVDKLVIETTKGARRVRRKDVTPLHAGPIASLNAVETLGGDLREAWALLEDETVTLNELAELVYGEPTPSALWSAWQALDDDLYFTGSPSGLSARPASAVQATLQRRHRKTAAAEARTAFLQRLKTGDINPDDVPRMGEIVERALEQRASSPLLAAIGCPDTPVSAHRVLLDTGVWTSLDTPYASRARLKGTPQGDAPEAAVHDRRDLTALAAYAIDDESTTDPDDAISLDGDRLWIHIADVGSVVAPESDMDEQARERSATAYLRHRQRAMLPEAVIDQLGLGLKEVSPALSIGLRYADGQITDIEVCRSRVRVTRVTYDDVQTGRSTPAWRPFFDVADDHQTRQAAAGAGRIDIPEVRPLVLENGRVLLQPLGAQEARNMVASWMNLAGEAIARWGLDRHIPLPFVSQAPPRTAVSGSDPASSHARRRGMAPSEVSHAPRRHHGVGADAYVRVTSPLRRYLDLVVHQQILAWLDGHPLRSNDDIDDLAAESEILTRTVRRVQRESELHWKLTYLAQHPDWRGEGVVVGPHPRYSDVWIPALGMTRRVWLRGKVEANMRVRLRVAEIDLAAGEVVFKQV